jgi:hypothetical protein
MWILNTQQVDTGPKWGTQWMVGRRTSVQQVARLVGLTACEEHSIVCSGGTALTGACEEAYILCTLAQVSASEKEEDCGEHSWAMLDGGVLALHTFVACMIQEAMEESPGQVCFPVSSTFFVAGCSARQAHEPCGWICSPAIRGEKQHEMTCEYLP